MDKRLCKLYDKYNSRYWNGSLPACVVLWGKLKEDEKKIDLGITRAYEDNHFSITLNPKVRSVGWAYVKLILLHEMCHVSLFPNFTHGRKFQNEMKRLAAAGAFDKLW